jgi:hypothetical protein
MVILKNNSNSSTSNANITVKSSILIFKTNRSNAILFLFNKQVRPDQTSTGQAVGPCRSAGPIPTLEAIGNMTSELVEFFFSITKNPSHKSE